MEKIENPWLLYFIVSGVSLLVVYWTIWIFSKFGYKQDPNRTASPQEAWGSLIEAPISEEFFFRALPMVVFYYLLPHPWWVGYWIIGGPVFGGMHGARRAFSHSIGGLILTASFYAVECNAGIVTAYAVNVLIHFLINFFFETS